MDQAADHDSTTPLLRVARYLPVTDTGPGNETPTPGQAAWPRISDYWPPAPQQFGPPADYYEIPSARPARTGQALFTRTLAPSASPDRRAAAPSEPSGPPAGEPRRRRLWTTVGALAVLSAAVGGGVLLTRTTSRPGPDAGPPARAASAAPGAAVLPGPATAPVPPDTGGYSAAIGQGALPATATVELVSNTTQWVVRTAPLAGRAFSVSTPRNAGITTQVTFTAGVLRLSVTPVGSGGSGRVDVVLSDRVTWRLRMTGGVERASFDLGRGTVSLIDLTGGATEIDMFLGRQAATVPIRMSGGVHSWRIETEDVIPARINIRRGAGSVVLNGQRQDGVRRDTTIRSGDLGRGAGIDIDAIAGIGSLRVTSS